MFSGDLEFKKVELSPTKQTGGTRYKGMVRLMKNGKSKLPNLFCISPDVAKRANAKPGTRFDLLQAGNLFALEPSSCGLLEMKQNYYICNLSLAIHLRAATGGCLEYDAWVDGGKILFKPRAKEVA